MALTAVRGGVGELSNSNSNYLISPIRQPFPASKHCTNVTNGDVHRDFEFRTTCIQFLMANHESLVFFSGFRSTRFLSWFFSCNHFAANSRFLWTDFLIISTIWWCCVWWTQPKFFPGYLVGDEKDRHSKYIFVAINFIVIDQLCCISLFVWDAIYSKVLWP